MECDKSNSGATLVEVIAVIGITAIMAAAVFRLLPEVMSGTKRGDVRSDVMRISQKVQELYRGEQYDGDMHSLVFGALPSIKAKKNPFGGEYVLAPADAEGKFYRITITGLSHADCVNLLTGWAEPTFDSSGKTLKMGRALVGDGSSLYSRNTKCEDMPEDDVKITIIYR